MDILTRRALLFDFYGLALSERQRRAYQLHYLEDLSLSECAEELLCSRPAALSLVRRAERALEELDLAIGAIAQHMGFLDSLHAMREALASRDIERAQVLVDAQIKELESDV